MSEKMPEEEWARHSAWVLAHHRSAPASRVVGEGSRARAEETRLRGERDRLRERVGHLEGVALELGARAGAAEERVRVLEGALFPFSAVNGTPVERADAAWAPSIYAAVDAALRPASPDVKTTPLRMWEGPGWDRIRERSASPDGRGGEGDEHPKGCGCMWRSDGRCD